MHYIDKCSEKKQDVTCGLLIKPLTELKQYLTYTAAVNEHPPCILLKECWLLLKLHCMNIEGTNTKHGTVAFSNDIDFDCRALMFAVNGLFHKLNF